ncbi:MAG: polysaccharide biosynthesis C-terminal domain-containing protein [Porcipelethomonas sp.]
MKKQSFIKGSVILIVSAVIAKAAGALFKIPLTNMLGGTGMGYFSCAYGLFLPVYALTANGLTTAAAKLTADSCAKGNFRNARKIYRVSLMLFTAIGLAGTALAALLAGPFSAKIAACPEALLSVIMIAPSVLFGCVTAVYRGCWEGMRNMYPTAVSQVIESVMRLLAGLALCTYVLKHPEKVLPFLPEGTDIIAAAAAAAVLGITISTAAGTLFLMILGVGPCENSSCDFGHEESTKKIISSLFAVLVPVALGSVITNLTSLIDLATIIRCLDRALAANSGYIVKKFGLYALERNEISNFIYGSFTGLAVTVFNLIPSVTNMFGKGILPNIAGAWTQKNSVLVSSLSGNVIKATAFLAVPSGLGISFLSGPVLRFLFPSGETECKVSSESMFYLGFAVIFLALSFPVFSMLQAIGRADAPVKIMLAGVAVKLIGNLLLIQIPEINVSGAAISTLACYIVIFLLSWSVYSKAAGVRIKISRLLLPPVFSGLMCAAAARLVYDNLPFDNLLALPVSVASGGAVYLIFSFLTGNIIVKRKKQNVSRLRKCLHSCQG